MTGIPRQYGHVAGTPAWPRLDLDPRAESIMASTAKRRADTGPIVLPPDSHVHSQWSWDALAGSMHDTCLRAVEIGLPAVAFTEHADLPPWSLLPGEKIPDDWQGLVSGGVLTPPPVDLDGFQDCLHRCRER